MEFCDALRTLRAELGLTQMELANTLHVSFATVSRWELGKTYPNRSMLSAVYDYAKANSVSKDCVNRLKLAITNVKIERLSASGGNPTSEHQPLAQLIDNASFPLYVCDFQTNELLYLNHKAEEMLGGTLDTLESRKCYKAIMHLDKPCLFCHKNVLCEDRFISFDAFRPEENTFHRVQGKLIRWNGRKAQVRYILDASNPLSVTVQSGREATYFNRLQTLKSLSGDAIAASHYNLTHDTLTELICSNEELRRRINTTSLDEMLIALGKNTFSDDDRASCEKVKSREQLIKQFYTGETHINVRHYMKSRRSYFDAQFDLMQNPVTYDVEVFVLLRDITSDMVTGAIASKLLGIDYESIATLDAETGEAEKYIGGHLDEVVAVQREKGDNVAGVEQYLRDNCTDEDIERVITETSLTYVKKRLETADTYTTAYSLREKRGSVRKRVLYTYLDDMKTIILCAMQNVSDLLRIESIQRDSLAISLRTIQELSGSNLARYDLKTKAFYSNSDMATAVGFGSVIENVPEAFIEKGLIAPASIDESRSFYERLCGGESGTLNAACRVADGSFHWLRVDARVIKDEEGKPSVAIMLFKDIEEQREQAAVYKKWRQSLEQRKPETYSLYRCNLTKGSAFDRCEGSLITAPLSMELRTFNERARDYAGRFVHIDDFDAYVTLMNSERLLASFYRGVRNTSLDYRERVRDDEYRLIHLSIELTQYPDTSDVEAFLMHEPLGSALHDDMKPVAMPASMFESTGVVSARYDSENKRFIYDPQMGERLLGTYDKRPLWEIFMSDDVADTQDIKAMRQLVHGLAHDPRRSSGSMELMLKSPSGVGHWFNMYVFRQLDAGGKYVGMVLTFIDINDDVLTNRKLHFQAEHDSLTGLYNRAAFLRLAAETVKDKPAASFLLVCSDINDFRFFNERYGRAEGDKLLRFAAEKLHLLSQTADGFAGRLSNDVFALLLPNSSGMLDKITEINKGFFSDYPLNVKITVRSGAFIICDPAAPADSMLDMAATAKESINGKYEAWLAVYDESMNEKRLREKQISDKMELALKQEQFDVYMQPQFHHATGQIVGAEALARWIDPERGVISPAEFIPVFEKNGFITKLDEYIWERTARYLSEWMEKGNEPVPVSVNVSREDTKDPQLCEKLLAIVKRYSVPIQLFRLEITESLFAEDTKRLAEVVGNLQKAGFLIEMDDFGSGYSSLNILKDIPVDVLKLDMKFFSGKDNLGRGGMIINAVLRMSRWLKIPVIAEGVELKHQADFLLGIGCPTIQGYLYAKPMPAKDFEKLLALHTDNRLVPQNPVETTLDNHSFWNPESVDSQVFNSYIGAAAVFEYHGGEYEIVRMNRAFINLLGVNETELVPAQGLVSICEESKITLKKAVLEAIYSDKDTAARLFCSVRGERKNMRISLRVIAKASDRALLFVNAAEE